MTFELDVVAPNYRRAERQWPGAPTLVGAYTTLAACAASDAYGLCEHVKSFIECVCVTILTEYDVAAPSGNPSTTELLVAALRSLGLQNTRGVSKLDKVLSAFNKLSDALSDMRNEHGPVAHGKDGFLAVIAADHARAFLHTGDAILSVLLNAIDGTEPALEATREPYERFASHHERIDGAVGVEARVDDEADQPFVVVTLRTNPRADPFELRFTPSQLLYGLQRLAYIDVLRSVDEAPAPEPDEVPVLPAEAEPPALAVAPATPPQPEFVPTYAGRLEPLRVPLGSLLAAEDWAAIDDSHELASLTDSLLATLDQNVGLDWKTRDTLRARVKVACKRVLTRFGIDAQPVEYGAERLLDWFVEHGPAGSGDGAVAS